MKKTRVAINGFGRIGRHAFRAAWQKEDMEVVAINDLSDNRTKAHLLKYDTAYPTFPGDIDFGDESIRLDGKDIKAFREKDPTQLPWRDMDIDIVLECTGVFRTREGAAQHLTAGAKKVIISAPSKGEEAVKGFVRGVNCTTYASEDIIDNASCTTNCTAPVVQVMEQTFGIEKAMLTTIHSYTADQNLQDGPHKDLRRARAAAENIVPTSTGAAKATVGVIPNLQGKFDGLAIRVPTITVSLTDFTFLMKKNVSVEEVNAALKDAADRAYKGIIAVTDEPLVSKDFVEDPHSAIVDLGLTNVVDGNFVKVIAWYDNEWGYANRLVEMVQIVAKKL